MSDTTPRARPGAIAFPRLRPPGHVLRDDYMRPRGMTVTDLARLTCLPVAQMRGVIMGEPIDAACAIRFAAVFGNTERYWITLQATFDRERAQRRRESDGLGVL
jgi:addiction module HigA family antidote